MAPQRFRALPSGETLFFRLKLTMNRACCSSFSPMASLHEVLIDVICNGLALGVADCHRAGVVHSAPHPSIVTVRSRLRDAGVRAARLSDRCQCKRLLLTREVAEENVTTPRRSEGLSSWEHYHQDVSTRYEEIKQLCFVEAGLVEKHEHPAEKWIPYRDFGTIGKIIVSNLRARRS